MVMLPIRASFKELAEPEGNFGIGWRQIHQIVINLAVSLGVCVGFFNSNCSFIMIIIILARVPIITTMS